MRVVVGGVVIVLGLMGVIVRVGVTGLVLVLCFELWGQGSVGVGALFERLLRFRVVPMRERIDVGVRKGLDGFGEMAVFEDVDLGAGDAAAVYGFDPETGVDAERPGRVVEHVFGNAGVDEGAEKHVAGDTGEAIEVGDAHGDLELLSA